MTDAAPATRLKRDTAPERPTRALTATPTPGYSRSSHPPVQDRRVSKRNCKAMGPALRWMRESMVDELKVRLRKKAADERRPKRRRKRKAALAVSAAAMTFGTGATQTMPDTKAIVQPYSAPDPTQERVNAIALTASEDMKAALVEEEGVRLSVYRDVAGYPTVGVGHLVTPKDNLKVGDRISYDRALTFLEKDIAKAEKAVQRLVGSLKLYQHEFDALVDLVFNVGEGNVKPARSPGLNAAIANADYDAMAQELEYTTAAGRFARGLALRSERRQAIFMNATYENPRTA